FRLRSFPRFEHISGCKNPPSRSTSEIFSRRLLKKAKVKIRNGSNQVIKNICCNLLIIHPAFVTAKTIYFQRDSLGSRVQVAHDDPRILIDSRMAMQVSISIFSEDPEIGLIAAINKYAAVKVVRLVKIINLLLAP